LVANANIISLLDKDYNFIYLADSLPVKFPSFYKRLTVLLSENNIPYGFIPGTGYIGSGFYACASAPG
jgi:hypothetical protein